jgi:hypothetical protein
VKQTHSSISKVRSAIILIIPTASCNRPYGSASRLNLSLRRPGARDLLLREYTRGSR